MIPDGHQSPVRGAFRHDRAFGLRSFDGVLDCLAEEVAERESQHVRRSDDPDPRITRDTRRERPLGDEQALD